MGKKYTQRRRELHGTKNSKKIYKGIDMYQVINKSDLVFFMMIILVIFFYSFFFLVLGGFTGIGYFTGGGALSSAMKAGGKIFIFVCGTGACAFIFMVGYLMREQEKKEQRKPSIYQMGFKKFWNWLWSDIRRSKR